MSYSFEKYNEVIEHMLEKLVRIAYAEYAHRNKAKELMVSSALIPKVFLPFKVEKFGKFGTSLTLDGLVLRGDLYGDDNLLRAENRIAILSHIDQENWFSNNKTINEVDSFEDYSIDAIKREFIDFINGFDMLRSDLNERIDFEIARYNANKIVI